ncbi:hypothetical protein ACQUQP_00030 [Marinobacterium sp. YM272]|uniref:hypothetical protein n=1 Tax=Marinobacterium sp. YM272 TaxID=3421654 RepID=UPI003D7FCF52
MDRPTPSADKRGLLKQLLPVAGILVVCLLLSTALLFYSAERNAEQEARDYGQNIGRATAILIQPLLLADDRISLNYVFNELNKQPQLNGLNLIDANRLPVAVAGSQSGLRQTLELSRDDERLGELTLWVEPEYSRTMLLNQLMEAGALGLATLILTLLTLWFTLKRNARPAVPEATDFRTLATDVAPGFDAYIDDEDDELRTATGPEPYRRDTQVSPAQSEPRGSDDALAFEDLSGDALDDDPDEPLSFADEAPDVAYKKAPEDRAEITDFEPQLNSWLKPMDNQAERESPTVDEPGTEQLEPQAATAAETSDRDDNRELVELLRPSRGRQGMPPFTPQDHRDEDSDEAIAPDMDQVEFDDSAEAQPAEKPRLSVVKPLGSRAEEQLGLYTLEQELELMLQAKDAGYLFLIDATSARSENISEEERQQLLRPYRTLANSVAHIYSGRVEPGQDGDLQLFFDEPKDDDSHGINALCSAMLFSYLYRHYNQHRIRQFKPVINLHLALVRGRHERLDRLQEEAHFLTRTTESNELISHTALTESPELKATLLENADIRREDEDKVLILKVAKSYQDLLEKQARHLLSKLQSREQEQAGN